MARIRQITTFSWSFDRRVMRRVTKTDAGCWQWNGSTTRNGYGQLRIGGKHWMAHRFSYNELVGKIPDGKDLDHLCRNRRCVNPKHLEPVTRSVNLARGDTGKFKKRRVHCYRGHLWTKETTILSTVSGGRIKRECKVCRDTRMDLNGAD